MRLSMVMIARDEAENVRPCFASFWEHVDEVVLCDTGSRDGTISEARKFAKERGEPGKLIVGRFKWCDDFAAARNHAHSLATGDVHARIDLDERLTGGERLADVAARFTQEPELRGIVAPWVGSMTTHSSLERIWRAPITWSGRTGEATDMSDDGGLTVAAAPEVGITDQPRWVHTRIESHGRRDLDIALKWAEEDPGYWLPWAGAAWEALELEEWELVVSCASRAKSSPDIPALPLGIVLQSEALAERRLGNRAEAWRLAGQAVRTWRDLPAAWALLSECALERGDLDEAILCTQRSLRPGAASN